jgi:hypothetical protein
MNILDSTNGFFARAIKDNTLGNERVDHAIGISVVPDANGQPTMVTAVVLRMASIIVNEAHTMGFFVNTPTPSQDEVTVAVTRALADLRKMRDADLNIPQGAPGAATQGLILK